MITLLFFEIYPYSIVIGLVVRPRLGTMLLFRFEVTMRNLLKDCPKHGALTTLKLLLYGIKFLNSPLNM
jgi:hypothetical protein